MATAKSWSNFLCATHSSYLKVLLEKRRPSQQICKTELINCLYSYMYKRVHAEIVDPTAKLPPMVCFLLSFILIKLWYGDGMDSIAAIQLKGPGFGPELVTFCPEYECSSCVCVGFSCNLSCVLQIFNNIPV